MNRISSNQSSSLKIVAALPSAILEGKEAYKKIQSPHSSSKDTIEMGGKLSTLLLDTDSSKLSELWKKVEKELHGGRSLPIKNEREERQLATTLGLFYPIVEQIHQEEQVGSFRSIANLYGEVKNHVERRLLEGKEDRFTRTLKRVFTVLDKQFSAATENFNKKIREKLLPGPLLTNSFSRSS